MNVVGFKITLFSLVAHRIVPSTLGTDFFGNQQQLEPKCRVLFGLTKRSLWTKDVDTGHEDS